MMRARHLAVGILFLAGAFIAAGASAAELKVLSVEAMKPALQDLGKAFETATKHKLHIDFATAADIEKKIAAEDEYDVVIVDKAIVGKLAGAAKLAAGSIKVLAKSGADTSYDAALTNWCQLPLDAQALIDFLSTPKAAEVYKAKGMQPG